MSPHSLAMRCKTTTQDGRLGGCPLFPALRKAFCLSKLCAWSIQSFAYCSFNGWSSKTASCKAVCIWPTFAHGSECQQRDDHGEDRNERLGPPPCSLVDSKLVIASEGNRKFIHFSSE